MLEGLRAARSNVDRACQATHGHPFVLLGLLYSSGNSISFQCLDEYRAAAPSPHGDGLGSGCIAAPSLADNMLMMLPIIGERAMLRIFAA
ncbi:hypothetical protein AcidC75_19690 [Acidisoma sp. C75]